MGSDTGFNGLPREYTVNLLPVDIDGVITYTSPWSTSSPAPAVVVVFNGLDSTYSILLILKKLSLSMLG